MTPGESSSPADTVPCSRCPSPAITVLRNSGIHLCGEHFAEDIEQRVRHSINEYSMIKEGDRIAVALSGGKDSTVLLYLLHKFLHGRKDLEIFALTVDEGIAGYREDTISSAEHISASLGIDHIIVSFREEYGRSLDELLRRRENRACTVCGVLRRQLLQRAARANGATKLATGHSLDDEVQSAMMNILRGDVRRIARVLPSDDASSFVPRVKPLRDIPEREVAMYGMVKGIYVNIRDCPYARFALRSDVRSLMNEMEYRHPGTLHRVMNGYDALTSRVGGMFPNQSLLACRECGEPCTGERCSACALVHSMNRENMGH